MLMVAGLASSGGYKAQAQTGRDEPQPDIELICVGIKDPSSIENVTISRRNHSVTVDESSWIDGRQLGGSNSEIQHVNFEGNYISFWEADAKVHFNAKIDKRSLIMTKYYSYGTFTYQCRLPPARQIP
jgi:hypothetical protein